MNLDLIVPWCLLAIVTTVGSVIVARLKTEVRRLSREGHVMCGNHTHRWIDRIDDFVRLVADSRLVDIRHVRQSLAEFHESRGELSRFGDTITGFSAFLVSHDVLTCWQVAKLRQGQFKGFYEISGYRLLDNLGGSIAGKTSTYLAESVPSGEVVAIEISPPLAGQKLLHRVTRVLGNRRTAVDSTANCRCR